jgi:hypothetical protein
VSAPALPFRQATYALDPVTGLYTVPFKQILRVRLLLDSEQLKKVSHLQTRKLAPAAAMAGPSELELMKRCVRCGVNRSGNMEP